MCPYFWEWGSPHSLRGQVPGLQGHSQTALAWGWLHLCVLSQRSFLSGIHLWNLADGRPFKVGTISLSPSLSAHHAPLSRPVPLTSVILREPFPLLEAPCPCFSSLSPQPHLFFSTRHFLVCDPGQLPPSLEFSCLGSKVNNRIFTEIKGENPCRVLRTVQHIVSAHKKISCYDYCYL